MRKEWKIKKLSEVCSFFTDGNWVESKDQSESGYRLIQTGNVGLGEFRHKSGKERYVSESTFHKLRCTEIFEGDILISRLPDPVGRSCIVPALEEKMITAVDCSILRLKEEQLLPSFFQYYAQSSAYFNAISEKITGTTRDRISRSNLSLIPIPVPNLEQQQQIVAILDEAFTAIDQAKANIEHNLQNAKELFQSELNAVFSNKASNWEQKTLSEIATEFGRGKSKHRPRNDARLFGGDHPFVQTGDVRNATKFIKNYTQTYNEVGLSQSKLWPIDTICITIAANIAESAILSFDSCFPDSIIGLIVNSNKANTEYTYYLLQYFKEELQKLGKGSAQDNINLSTFEHQKFPFPPLVEQRDIVSKLNRIADATNKLTVIYKQKIQAVENLKKSILQKAFTGELKTLEEAVL